MSLFQIVCLDDGAVPLRDGDGNPVLFPTGTEAAAFAVNHSAATGKKYQPRRVLSNDWRQREQGRFDLGEYVKVPWHDAIWFKDSLPGRNHYLHVSINEPGKVAFTETPEKGGSDIQTRMKAGKYLTRFFSDALSSLEIRTLATAFSELYEDNQLQFADTADDFEWVYTNGPTSCMSYGADHFESPFHPVRVYAAGDLAVAYITRNDRVTARALCWPEKKVYGRLYGDEYRLQCLLETAGYAHKSTQPFNGARLKRHLVDHQYMVLPYIDWCSGVADYGDYLKIERGGELTCEATNGMVDTEEGDECGHCGSRYSDDDLYYLWDGMRWCRDCVDENAVEFEHTGDHVPIDDAVSMEDGSFYWRPDIFRRQGFTSDLSGVNYRRNDRVYVNIDSNTVEEWSRDEADEKAVVCEYSGAFIHADSAVTLTDGTIWSQWAFDDHGMEHPETGEPIRKSDYEEETDETASPRRAPSPTQPHPDQTEMDLAY